MGFRLRAPRINVRRIFTPPAAVKKIVREASAPIRVGATVGLTGGGSLLFSRYGQGLLGKATALAQNIFQKPEAPANYAEDYAADNRPDASSIFPRDLLAQPSGMAKYLPWAVGAVALAAVLWAVLRRRS